MAVRMVWVSGKARRFTRNPLAHLPSGKGKGRWHSIKALWASKLKARTRRKMAARSRRINRSQLTR